jgi:hypothetical protein
MIPTKNTLKKINIPEISRSKKEENSFLYSIQNKSTLLNSKKTLSTPISKNSIKLVQKSPLNQESKVISIEIKSPHVNKNISYLYYTIA